MRKNGDPLNINTQTRSFFCQISHYFINAHSFHSPQLSYVIFLYC